MEEIRNVVDAKTGSIVGVFRGGIGFIPSVKYLNPSKRIPRGYRVDWGETLRYSALDKYNNNYSIED